MTRGRKKKENALRKNITIRITEEQKEVINKNNWIKKELNEMVRNHLNTYL